MSLDSWVDHSPLGSAGLHESRRPVRAVIVAAMAPEIAPFVDRADDLGEPYEVGNATLRTGRLAGADVLLIHCGIGLVNAASAVTAALLDVDAGLVVSVGSAGGIRERIAVGEVAVSTQLTYSTADAVGFGYAMGQVPGMPEHFKGDAAAVTVLSRQPHVVPGLFASGDVFVQGPLLDAVLANFPEVLAVDMESTAIAQVCHAHGVGFVSVRGISDLCGPAAEQEHTDRVDDVSVRAADAVEALLRAEG